jgi:MYXO-CTERM domain-containing protein
VKRGGDLKSFLKQDVPELKISGLGPGGVAGLDAPNPDGAKTDSPADASSKPAPSPSTCSCDVGAQGNAGPIASLALGALGVFFGRRRRAPR